MSKEREVIIQYLLEGNNREDLAEQVYDLLPQVERNKILDDIDNIQLDIDVSNSDPEGKIR